LRREGVQRDEWENGAAETGMETKRERDCEADCTERYASEENPNRV